MWQSIGADVTLKFFDPNDFSQNVLRPENEALLFGEIVRTEILTSLPSSAHHKSRLNIALYTNIKADKLLSKLEPSTTRPTD